MAAAVLQGKGFPGLQGSGPAGSFMWGRRLTLGVQGYGSPSLRLQEHGIRSPLTGAVFAGIQPVWHSAAYDDAPVCGAPT